MNFKPKGTTEIGGASRKLYAVLMTQKTHVLGLFDVSLPAVLNSALSISSATRTVFRRKINEEKNKFSVDEFLPAVFRFDPDLTTMRKM